MIKKALLVQIRDDKKIALQEYKSFLKLAKKAGARLSRINVCYQPLSLKEAFKKYDAFMIGGSEFSVQSTFNQKGKVYKLIRNSIKSKKPFLGVCFGFQLLVEAIGGKIFKNEKTNEFGTVAVLMMQAAKAERIASRMPGRLMVQQAHFWGCLKKPKNTQVLFIGKNGLIQGVKVDGTPTYGVQFHPELTRQDMILRMKMYNSKKSSTYAFSKKDMKKIKSSAVSEKIITNFLSY